MAGTKPGDAIGDKAREEFDANRKERELAIERLRIRAEMRSEEEIEDSGVIHMRAEERQKQKESEPPTKVLLGILAVPLKAKGWPQVVALAVVVAALCFVAWLKWR